MPSSMKPSTNLTYHEAVNRITPGPHRLMVIILPEEETSESSLLEIPESIKANPTLEIRTCEILKVGKRITMDVSPGDKTMVIYRPTQKLWDTFTTTDGHDIVFIPEELIVGATWN